MDCQTHPKTSFQGSRSSSLDTGSCHPGIPIITPALNFGENPRTFHISPDVEEVWAVYPYIAGNAYYGNLTQIAAAGRLLGEIHAAGMQGDFGLKRIDSVVAISAAEIEEDIKTILQTVHRFLPEYTVQAREILAQRSEKYFQESLPRLTGTELPLANCSWDYKASNLIYQTDASPILIDADNAGYIPRAYDLAIAALLFHNEGKGPARLFTRAEWETFLAGYTRRVRFTQLEKQAWNDLLLCAWIDEGMWLLGDDQSGWRTHARPNCFSACSPRIYLSTLWNSKCVSLTAKGFVMDFANKPSSLHPKKLLLRSGFFYINNPLDLVNEIPVFNRNLIV